MASSLVDIINSRLATPSAPALAQATAPASSLVSNIQSALAPSVPATPDFQAPAVPGEADKGISLFGFFGNVIGDIQEFAVGIGQLGAAIVGDITKIPGDLLGGTVEGGYATANIIRALPSVLKADYSTRYGSPEAIARGLYEDPLSYFLDALMVGDIAALGSRIAGKAAISSSKAAMQTAEVMTTMYGKSAGVRAGLDVLKTERELGPVEEAARRILPGHQTAVVDMGGKSGLHVMPLSQARNPVTRATTQTLFRRITSHPLSRLVEEADELRPYVETGRSLPWMDVRLQQIDTVLQEATKTGATRLQNKFVAQWDLRRVVDRMASQAHADLLRANSEDANRVNDIHSGLSKTEAELGAGEYQRMSVGMSSHGWNPVDVTLGPEEGIGVTQPSTDLNELMGLIPDAHTQIHGTLHHAIGGDRMYGPRIKSAESASRRAAINNELLARVGSIMSPLQDAGGIEDLLGFRILLDDWKQAPEVVAKIREQMPIVSIDNYLGGGPNGMRGARVYVQANNGLVAEIQLHTPYSMKLEDVAAPVHKYIRELEEHIALGEGTPATAAVQRLPKAPIPGPTAKTDFQVGDTIRWVDTADPEGRVLQGEILDFHTTNGGTRMYNVELPNGGKTFFSDYDPARSGVQKIESAASAPVPPPPVAVAAPPMPQLRVSPASQRDLEMARMYERGLYGGVAREIEAGVAGRELTGIEKAMEDMRLFIQERFANPMMEKGLMTPSEALERAFRPLKMMSGARWNPKLGAFEGGEDTLELARMLDDAGITQPLYFPHIDARRLSRRTFLMSKSPRAARAITKSGHERLDTMYLFEQDLYLKDPIEAYIRRAAAANRAEETFRFHQWVLDEFGRKISATDEIIPNAEALYDPDGLWRFYRQYMTIEDDLRRMARQNVDFDSALAESLERAIDVGSEEVLQKMAHAYVGVARNPIYAIPKTVAKRLEAHSAQMLGEAEGWVRLFVDSPLSLWRWTVLAASPRWVMNNTFGNIYFLKMQGGRLRDVMQLMIDRYFKKPLNDALHAHFNTDFTDIVDGLAGIDNVGSGFFSAPAMASIPRLGSAEDTLVGRFYGRLGRTKVAKAGSKWGEFVRTVNSHIEQAFREASYLRAIERQQIAANVKRAASEFWSSKEHIRGIAERGVGDPEAALQEVNRFFGDYLTLGPYERKIIRRFLMPFYGFYKHVTKLMLRFPFESPIRAAVMTQLAAASSDIAAETGPVPEWLAKGWPLGPGDDEGTIRFASTSGLNPFSIFSQTPLSMLNPIWKLIYEQSSGRSSFTGKEFTAPDVVTPFGSDQQYRILVDENGMPIDAVPIEKLTPGIGEHILQQIPLYQIAKDALAQGATYSTSTLLDVAEGKGVIRDPGGAPMFPESPLEGLAQYVGVPGASTFDVDVADFQQRQQQERESALLAYARRFGLVPAAGEER